MINSKIRNYIHVSFLLLCITTFSQAEEIRDYYSEPGLHPAKELSSDLNETIDPFSGTLQIRHQDVVVPGNGGMDIAITRVYTNHQDDDGKKPGYHNLYGVGWTMGYGRIVVPSAHAAKICDQSQYSVNTLDNPSLEHPDGSRELLFLATGGEIDLPALGFTGEYLITKSNWIATCINDGSGMIVTAPNGTVYTMDVRSEVAVTPDSENNEVSWHASSVVDVYGNILIIEYETDESLGYKYIDRVSGDGGREVDFTYIDAPGDCKLLDSITSEGRTWTYEYGVAVANDIFNPGTPEQQEINLCRYHLDRVNLPEGQSWEYQYYPNNHPDPGKYSLSKITYPYGGTVDYTYQHVAFDIDPYGENGTPDPSKLTTAIATKTIGGREIESETWQYDFYPASFLVEVEDPDGNPSGVSKHADQTVITHPNLGRVEYIHQGANLTGTGNVWFVGLMIGSESFSASGDSIEKTINSYSRRRISLESYSHGNPNEFDAESYVPILKEKQVVRDGFNFPHITTYNSHDVFGNPTMMTEGSGLVGDDDKVTTISYFNDPDSYWIVGAPKDESTTIGAETSSIQRTYNNRGKVESETVNGVETAYTYTSDGDVFMITDANGHAIMKDNYVNGIAELETHPEGIVLQRKVNNTGTVQWHMDGENNLKTFSYDDRNRLTSIVFPKASSSSVSVIWTDTSKTLTRGDYKETVVFDGFGRQISITRDDTNPGADPNNVNTIQTLTKYDEYGRKYLKLILMSLSMEMAPVMNMIYWVDLD